MEEKIDGFSMDIEKNEREKLKEIFPMCFTEGDKLDIDKLLNMCGSYITDDYEKYEFKWKGKSECLQTAQRQSNGTLRPCTNESKNFDDTNNIYIEGDNLEVIKLLQKSYYKKVKMIYIDPPYNTGNDFIYEDDFKMPIERYKEVISEATKSNPESMGRFHTNWLNMIYPRLRLAHNLLRDDGVMFISIDDNEVHNLRKICDEVFGEENFVNIVTVKTKIAGVSGSSEGKSLKDATEFILIYSKNKNELLFNPTYIKTPLFDRIKKYEDEGKSWKYTSIITKLEDKVLIKNDTVRNMKVYGYNSMESMSISAFAKQEGLSIEDVYNSYADKIYQTTNAQSSVRQTVMNETTEFDFPMIGLEYVPIKGKNAGSTIEILYKGEQRRMMMFLSDAVEKIDDTYYYMDRISSLWDDIEYNNLTKEGNIEFANGKKPIKLLQRIIQLSTDSDSIILDFFSGSSSTAHAVMELNAEDGGNRQFIMVQIPELCDEKSEAYKSGYKNICEIGKERIRRAGDKIVSEKQDMLKERETPLDIGFKVLKLDTSNFKLWDTSPIDEEDGLLLVNELERRFSNMTERTKPNRSDLEIIFELMLKLGFPLNSKIEPIEINDKVFYEVSTTFEETFVNMIICLDKGITSDDVMEIMDYTPAKIIFGEDCFVDFNELTNARIELEKEDFDFMFV